MLILTEHTLYDFYTNNFVIGVGAYDKLVHSRKQIFFAVIAVNIIYVAGPKIFNIFYCADFLVGIIVYNLSAD